LLARQRGFVISIICLVMIEITPSAQPWIGLDTRDADVVIDIFNQAREANINSSLRKGAVVHLPERGKVLMTGDLHDHGPNLNKIIRLSDIDRDASNHVVLHEVIHGDGIVNDTDLSVRMLTKVATLKAAFPDQVHLLQSNHELAQYRGDGILKHNLSVCEAFTAGVDYIYGDRGDEVTEVLKGFIRSYPLAIRTQRGVMFSHSLPSVKQMKTFDTTILEREVTDEDLEPGGAGYVLSWGRYQSQEVCDELAEKWGVDVFVCGHQPADMGYELMTRTLMILASNHDRGMALPIDLARRYDMDKLVEGLIPLSALS